ncbi:MAG: DUF4266 domain-containing protein [Sandaracinaceae bacterium]|jgi:hypothetical protein|nr:DUF4266 domain-containing protein [Sandaracinaceae bacterium]
MNLRLLTSVLLLACFFSAACAHVAPYEREDLARPSMDVARESSEMGFRAHVHEAREGASGGVGAAGGGCGCN